MVLYGYDVKILKTWKMALKISIFPFFPGEVPGPPLYTALMSVKRPHEPPFSYDAVSPHGWFRMLSP